MTNFNVDLAKEQKLSEYLDMVYRELKIPFSRNNNLDLQFQGVDLIYTNGLQKSYIDEKAQLNYLNHSLPTFAFELSYLNKKKKKIGWLIDSQKITTHYFLVTSIYLKNNDISSGFKSCKIISVDRDKLLFELEKIGLSVNKLIVYDNEFRNKEKCGKIEIKELNKREGVMYYSTQLEERPINLVLRHSFYWVLEQLR